MAYVSGFVAAVPAENKAAFIDHSRAAWALFEKHGALEQWECWGDNVPDGKVTSFAMAVKAEPDEVVAFSWILWPDKATAEACQAAMQTDPEWQSLPEMPFDGKRMIFGDFHPVVMERRA